MPRISTFSVALTLLALSANGASAVHLVSVQPPRFVAPTKQHWIEVNSFQFGVGPGLGSPVGNGGTAGKASISDISVSRFPTNAACRHCPNVVVPGTK